MGSLAYGSESADDVRHGVGRRANHAKVNRLRQSGNLGKPGSTGAVAPNLSDYASAVKGFSWKTASHDLKGLPEGGLNIAYEAVDRHMAGPFRDQIALRFLTRDGDINDFSYAQLHELTNRFANVLKRLGVGPGDRVATLLGHVPDQYVAALGTLKNRSVFCPLYAAFGPEPIQTRLNLAQARILVTTEALFHRKIEQQLEALPSLKYILISGPAQNATRCPICLDLVQLMQEAYPHFQIDPTDPEDWALLHYTSGTTGTPKGVVHVQDAVRMHSMTGKLALDIHPGDTFWCTADPGWVTGTSHGIIAPLTP